MLTAREMQDLLQVDRSTIYRMAEAGQLPAVKVGKQWRFPADGVENWLASQSVSPAPGVAVNHSAAGHATLSHADLASMLPLECVQLIQDAFAELLGVMLVVTHLDGQPITQVSNPGRLYEVLARAEGGFQMCYQKWRELGQVPALEPRFAPSLAGLLCARALVRIGDQLKGMVVVFGVAPPDWAPAPEDVRDLADSLNLPAEQVHAAFDTAARLTHAEQKKVLVTLQRTADILAHISNERVALLDRLASIAQLSAI
jgi:excisionase family DNA binding protein